MSQTAGFIGISRHRINTDGPGVTTLAAFHGCPLDCRYCLNPSCKVQGGSKHEYSTDELIEKLAKDELYFFATGGGVCFGGGEPLLYSDFIEEFYNKLPYKCNVTIETSLAVPLENLRKVIPFVNEFIVDIKDMHPLIYGLYTGKTPELRDICLKELIPIQERVLIRIPHIPGFNSRKCIAESKQKLQEMGFCRFDLFEYETFLEEKRELRKIQERIHSGELICHE